LRELLQPRIEHRFIRPSRTKTNEKAKCYKRTITHEWGLRTRLPLQRPPRRTGQSRGGARTHHGL